MAKGDFFLPADCDDSFLPETLEFFNLNANILPPDNDFLKSNYSGINVCCYDPLTNKIIGDEYPQDGLVSDNIELAYKYHIRGEHWGTIRTDILKEIPFPTIKGHFYNESYLWFSIALKYKLVCYNKALRAYFYEPNSLVHNKSYKLDKDLTYMWLNFHWWKLTHVGSRIRQYSFIEYLRLYKDILKGIVKYILARVVK